MFAIYWHAKMADGNIGIQGHDTAANYKEAQSKIEDALRRAKLSSILVSFDAIIVPPAPDTITQLGYPL